MKPAAPRGFTLVEMLVVISIIAILMALLFGGITSALKSSKNSKQLSDLRQMFTGWTLYANQYTDQCLPGFLSVETQKNWKVAYRMNGKLEGQTSDKLNAAVAQTYPWRLAPYLNYSWDLMLGYRDDANSIEPSTLCTIPPLAVESENLSAALRLIAPKSLAGSTAALQPRFGYNAFYLGGWWDLSKNPKTLGIPRPYFCDAMRTSTDHSANAMSRTVGGIAFPDRMTVFCPSSYLTANASNKNPVAPGAFVGGGATKSMAANQSSGPTQLDSVGGYSEPDPTATGAAWICPPWLGTERIWNCANAETSSLSLYTDQAVPLMRYSKQIPAAKADGSTRLQTDGELDDMREWVNLTDISNAQRHDSAHTGSLRAP